MAGIRRRGGGVRARLGLAGALAAAAASASAAGDEDRLVVHVTSHGIRTTIEVQGDTVLQAKAFQVQGGARAEVPRDPFADPDREVWILDADRKTRIRYRGGLEVARESWDRISGRVLEPEFHLALPPALDHGLPARFQSGSPGRRTAPRPAPSRPAPSPPAAPVSAAPPAGTGTGSVGAARPAADVFGETLGGLVPAKADLPQPIRFQGYIDVLASGQGNAATPHQAELGLSGNTSLEAREGVLNMDAGLGNKVRWFGQLRAVRFNAFDLRVNLLEIGDPAKGHALVGRQITPVGLFPVKNVSDRNPLVGFPLPYGYRSSLRPDVVPAGTAGILAARGTGGAGNGVGLAGPALYQTYILYQAPLGKKVTFLGGLENGAQSNMENRTVNDALGFIGRLSFVPQPAWKFGLTFSSAPWVQKGAAGLAAGESPEDFDQNLLAFDLEFAKGPVVFDFELLDSDWEVAAGAGVGDLGATGINMELKWTLQPRLYFAARYSAIDFDSIATGAGTSTPWDFGVDRLEIGFGYRPIANLVTKLVGQFNGTDSVNDPSDDLYALQVVGRF